MEILRTLRTSLGLAAALALALPGLPQAHAQAERQEYALKAVFLYNFCRFIQWPDRAFSSPNEPIVIGIIGQDPFGDLLEQTVQGEVVRGRRMIVERYRRPAEIRSHLLFVSAGEEHRLPEIFAAVGNRSIVTVGETEAFLDRGGMIALAPDGNRIRVRINPNRLRAASLVASSRLLRVAEIRL
jgi:hypothetical protein